MSLYLDVSLDPQDAPAMSERTVSAQLTAGWLTALNGAIPGVCRAEFRSCDNLDREVRRRLDQDVSTDPSDPFDSRRRTHTARASSTSSSSRT